jgi:hypothetical protein
MPWAVKAGKAPRRSRISRRAFGERQARRPVAETLASMGQPKPALADQGFRPDIFGQGEQGRSTRMS